RRPAAPSSPGARRSSPGSSPGEAYGSSSTGITLYSGSSAGGESAQSETAVVLVRRGDHAQRLARRALGDLGLGERRAEQALDPADALGREGQRVGAAPLADCTARTGRVADERAVRPALGAARQMGQVSREPEELQLEREDERVESRLFGSHVRSIQD